MLRYVVVGLLLYLLVACTSPSTQDALVLVPTVLPTASAVPPTATEPPPSPIPTLIPLPTLSPTPGPPTGNVVAKAALCSVPSGRVTTCDYNSTPPIICPGDTVFFLSQQMVDDTIWYLVRVQSVAGLSCGASMRFVNDTGWTTGTSFSAPSTSVEQYVLSKKNVLPTPMAIINATATIVPTYFVDEMASAMPAIPSGTRIGAICGDGSRSRATGRGACSHHGGVSRWLYAP